HDCTVLFGTSTFLSYYAAHANPADFARIRYVISGGEKLSPEVARVWLDKFGLRILEGYGCTECAPVISLATPSAHRSGTVGRLLPGMEYHIAPMEGIEKGGILHVRGPNLMLGHCLKEAPGIVQPCQSALGPGWYDTGDVAQVDEAGFVVIEGRVRRFAKIAGEMVSLDHIEQIARTASPGHFHAAVLAVEEYGGETTVLFTTDPALDRITLQRTARILGSRDLAVAREVVKVRELPMLRTGKTDYTGLAQLAQSQRPRLRERNPPKLSRKPQEDGLPTAQSTGMN
ncbi:MAG TPA: AMP-binding protein, partial [Burkholderiales bacterium]|nr:AMP-binding protein [Burkholderiales bacterium]